MTTELEKQFFDTFGIEPKTNREYGYKMAIYNEAGTEEIKFYPQITDRILLELICILGNTDYFLITDEGLPIDVDGLKKSVLHSLTLLARFDKNKELKQQVQVLFKE